MEEARLEGFDSRALTLLLCAAWCGACGSEAADVVHVSRAPDSGMQGSVDQPMAAPSPACDVVEIDGDVVIERETHYTARYRMGEPYTKTVMLFGGEAVLQENAFSNAYIFALDKEAALALAQQYPDFYLCSSPGGQAAAEMIVSYDLVPASCEVFEQIMAAVNLFNRNRLSGGDRTSIRFDGAPLELESVTENRNGRDATDEVGPMSFQLVTAVEQLTGESVLEFGTTQ